MAAMAAGAVWGLAVAWLFLFSVERAARRVVRGGVAGGMVRSAVVAGLLFAPALVHGGAVAGALLSFVVARNLLMARRVVVHAGR